MARTDKSGVKSSINPHRETSTDIRAKLFHYHRDWEMIKLRALVKEHEKQFGSRLPDDYLSARKAANDETARQTRYVLQDEIDKLWRDKVAGFERAVLDGDYKWFERQAKVIRDAPPLLHDWFAAAVARELEYCFCETRIEELKRIEAKISKHLNKKQPASKARDAHAKKLRELEGEREMLENVTLEPAGKRIDSTAQQILDRLECGKERRTKKGGQASREQILEGGSETVACVIVEGRRFESARRAREEIKRIAVLHRYELKQPPKKKAPRHG